MLLLKKYLPKAIGISIILYIITLIDYKLFSSIFKEVDWRFLIGSVFLFNIQIILKTIRWKKINDLLDINIPLFNTFKVNMIAGVLGSITPGRIGDLVKLTFVSKYAKDYKNLFVSYVVDRFSDIIIVIFFGLFSILFFKNVIKINTIAIAISLTFFILIFTFNFFNLKSFIKKLVGFVLPRDFNQHFVDNYNYITKMIFIIFKKSFFLLGTLSSISFIIQCLGTLFVAYAIGINISIYFILFAVSLSSITSFLPISIGGFGAREGVYIFILGYQGVMPEEAIALSLIDTVFVGILFPSILSAFIIISNNYSTDF